MNRSLVLFSFLLVSVSVFLTGCGGEQNEVIEQDASAQQTFEDYEASMDTPTVTEGSNF